MVRIDSAAAVRPMITFFDVGTGEFNAGLLDMEYLPSFFPTDHADGYILNMNRPRLRACRNQAREDALGSLACGCDVACKVGAGPSIWCCPVPQPTASAKTPLGSMPSIMDTCLVL